VLNSKNFGHFKHFGPIAIYLGVGNISSDYYANIAERKPEFIDFMNR